MGLHNRKGVLVWWNLGGTYTLTLNELTTLTTEIEAVFNARPLTYIYDDVEKISYPLTLSQLINGRTLETHNDKHFEVISTTESLTKRARYQKVLLQTFTRP